MPEILLGFCCVPAPSSQGDPVPLFQGFLLLYTRDSCFIIPRGSCWVPALPSQRSCWVPAPSSQGDSAPSFQGFLLLHHKGTPPFHPKGILLGSCSIFHGDPAPSFQGFCSIIPGIPAPSSQRDSGGVLLHHPRVPKKLLFPGIFWNSGTEWNLCSVPWDGSQKNLIICSFIELKEVGMLSWPSCHSCRIMGPHLEQLFIRAENLNVLGCGTWSPGASCPLSWNSISQENGA